MAASNVPFGAAVALKESGPSAPPTNSTLPNGGMYAGAGAAPEPVAAALAISEATTDKAVSRAIAASVISQVDANIFISGYIPAAHAPAIRDLRITRIVKMFGDDPSYPGGFHRHPGVAYLVCGALDHPTYDIGRHFMSAMKFIRAGIRNGERILVHCHAGISRSATIVALHLMVNRGVGLAHAVAYLRAVRPIVNPNAGFMAQLARIEDRIGAVKSK